MVEQRVDVKAEINHPVERSARARSCCADRLDNESYDRHLRLLQLDALLKARIQEAVDPHLRISLGRVKAALDSFPCKEVIPIPKAMSLAEAVEALKNNQGGHNGAPNVTMAKQDQALFAASYPSTPRNAARDCAHSPIVENSEGRASASVGLAAWSCTDAAEGAARATPHAAPTTPKTPRTAKQLRSPSQPLVGSKAANRKTNLLSTAIAAARNTSAASHCKDLEEIISSTPARVTETLQSTFVKLLSELSSLDQRLMAQTKLGNDMQARLMRSSVAGVSADTLRASEETYRTHVENFAAKDRNREVHLEKLLTEEALLLKEVDKLQEDRRGKRQSRLKEEHDVALQLVRESKQLVHLEAELDKHLAREKYLENEVACHSHENLDLENEALRRRMERLHVRR